MSNPNLWSAEVAGPILNVLINGPGYPPGLKVDKAVASLDTGIVQSSLAIAENSRVLGSLGPLVWGTRRVRVHVVPKLECAQNHLNLGQS